MPAALGCAACAVATAALVLVAYYAPGAQRLDATALHGFNTLEAGFLKAPTTAVAVLSGVLPIVPGVFVLYYLGSRWGRRRQAIAGILVVLLATATAELLKVLLAHPRTQSILGSHQVNAASFPSGTATTAMSFAIAMLLTAPPRWRAAVAAAGAAFVFLACFSVMVLLWHFPSDVLGGILVAVGYGFAAVAVLRQLDRRSAESRGAAAVSSPLPLATVAAIAAGAVLLGVVLASMVSWDVASYVGTYTTTVAAGFALSSAAATLLALFGLLAAESR